MSAGDGLRADKTFQYFYDPTAPASDNTSDAQDAISMAPFLRSRVIEEGTFGVSHTRVPTESRPGHVALIAGLYEDVAAVTTGWKLNPVEFDSVFNRSRHTWSWGSPDILPMFSIGATPGRVEDHMYDAAFEDYSKDATELDYWVFDHVKDFFKSAETDGELRGRLSQNRIVFFLHLLGIDTTGHAFRPFSQEYLRNIQVVDQGVQEISTIIHDYYGDDRTAYIFTADHGMSDWGSHGDGHPDNTRTPLIAWGSGIARPETHINENGKAQGHDDGFSADWQLDHIARHDVDQADIATLMAYLLDLEFPVNSVGKLPLAYLNATNEQKARALYTNAKQISEMYMSKEQQKMTEVIRYKPYRGFSGTEHNIIQNRVSSIETLLQHQDYDSAIQKSMELIDASLQGLRYLQTYAWFFLRTLVTPGYLGWVAFTFTENMGISKPEMIEIQRQRPGYSACFASIFLGLCGVLLMQNSPPTYYAYSAFPVFFWERALPPLVLRIKSQTKAWLAIWRENHSSMLQVAAHVVLLELLVCIMSLNVPHVC
jgi:phosphatidylinositol glycan class N